MSIEKIQDIANQCSAVIHDRIRAAKEHTGILAQLEVHALTGAAEGVSFLLNSLKEGFKNGQSDTVIDATLAASVADSSQASATTDVNILAASP